MPRSARQLVPRLVREAAIADAWCLLVCCVRNELVRMPAFLEHYRRLGVRHFLVVDNQSTDGLEAYLAGQPDCSSWIGDGSYKASNFGMDWCNLLLADTASASGASRSIPTNSSSSRIATTAACAGSPGTWKGAASPACTRR
jgi:hypothetical protein